MRVTRVNVEDAGVSERADLLAAEEPLGIRVDGQAVSLTMRTPGDDIDLAAGFLLSEGIVATAADVVSMRLCDGQRCGHDHGAGDTTGNVVDVALRPGLAVRAGLRRAFLTSSACGVCGKTSIDDLHVPGRFDLSSDQVTVTAQVLAGLPDKLRDAQRVFERTGGLHAAGVFSAAGELLVVREDVGRHNAVDKVIGWALQAGLLPLTGDILLVSGRASFELVQKAVLAGIPVLAAVSAPSSLAVRLAADAGLTLVGFLRGRSMNVYAGVERISVLRCVPD
ncbi:MAG TPA: formate dehydrogenase accessory sulfurtransferase FdhD [Streptosporangiaceae bacterium]|nr:formate dehydrogenase accessory sulfurtransferase FdhD [Streptosporangiaceae bacterium]